jgi:hypothetical protein
MTTPAMVFSSVLKLMVISLGVFWSVSFVVSRLFIFYEAYINFHSTLKDEEWLRIQCELPEFYSNMRQHSDLCNNVRHNAERSAVLIALNEVAGTAHLCGRQSCVDSLASLSTSAGWPVLVAIAVTVLLAPTVLVRVARSVVGGGGDARRAPMYLDHQLRPHEHHHYGKLL